MDLGESASTGAAAVMNAAWLVRHNSRPGMGAARRAALENMARVTLTQLAAGQDAEAILYAVAAGLYCRSDPRFAV